MRWRTVETLGFAALLARCGDGKGVIESLVALPVHSLQLSSDADLLRCFRNDEHRDSKLNFPFSVNETNFGVSSKGKQLDRIELRKSQNYLRGRLATVISRSHGDGGNIGCPELLPTTSKDSQKSAFA